MNKSNFTKLNKLNFIPIAQNHFFLLPLNFTCFDTLSPSYSKQDIVVTFPHQEVVSLVFWTLFWNCRCNCKSFLSVKEPCNHCSEKTITRFSIVEVLSGVFKFLDALEFPWPVFISCENERRCWNLFKQNLCQTKNQLKFLMSVAFWWVLSKLHEKKGWKCTS